MSIQQISKKLGWSGRRLFPPDANVSSSLHHLHFYFYTPTSSQAPLPLVVFLHGGTRPRGRENEKAVLPAEAFHSAEAQLRHPCFVLRPITGQLRSWVHGTASPTHLGKPYRAPRTPPKPMLVLMRLIAATLRAEPRIDARRLVLVGASMGAYGVFDLLGRCPQAFVAAVAIAGAGDPLFAPTMWGTRVWLFHAARDDQVGVNGSRRMLHALVSARRATPVLSQAVAGWRANVVVPPARLLTADDGEVRYTEFLGGGNSHTGSFYWALADPAVAEWAFGAARHQRTPPAAEVLERQLRRAARRVDYIDPTVAGWSVDGLPRSAAAPRHGRTRHVARALARACAAQASCLVSPADPARNSRGVPCAKIPE